MLLQYRYKTKTYTHIWKRKVKTYLQFPTIYTRLGNTMKIKNFLTKINPINFNLIATVNIFTCIWWIQNNVKFKKRILNAIKITNVSYVCWMALEWRREKFLMKKKTKTVIVLKWTNNINSISYCAPSFSLCSEQSSYRVLPYLHGSKENIPWVLVEHDCIISSLASASIRRGKGGGSIPPQTFSSLLYIERYNLYELR